MADAMTIADARRTLEDNRFCAVHGVPWAKSEGDTYYCEMCRAERHASEAASRITVSADVERALKKLGHNNLKFKVAENGG